LRKEVSLISLTGPLISNAYVSTVEEMMVSSKVMTARSAWCIMPHLLVYKDTKKDLKKVLKVSRVV
jgi:hypothetical protein